MTIQWRTAYDHYGDAHVAAGEAVTLELTIMVPDGDGWSVADLQGRSFVQRVVGDDGTVLAEIAGIVVGDEGEANFLRFAVTGTVTAGLLPTGSSHRALHHEIAELVGTGRDVLHFGGFSVQMMGAVLNGDANTPPAYRYVLQQGPRGRLVADFYRTTPGPFPTWDLSDPNSFLFNLWTGVL